MTLSSNVTDSIFDFNISIYRWYKKNIYKKHIIILYSMLHRIGIYNSELNLKKNNRNILSYKLHLKK